MNTQLKERITKLSNEDLLEVVERKSADYRKEAIDYAAKELESRGISFSYPVSVFSQDEGQRFDKPKPSVTEQVALLSLAIGIAMAITPFAVTLLTGMRGMSDVMVLCAFFGVVLLIIGAVLIVLSKSKAKRKRAED